MIQGLYTAANGMFAVEAKQAAIANNIANTSTPGYKRAEPILSGFYTEFSAQLRQPFHFDISPAPGGGVRVGETFADLAEGPLTETDNPLAMALQGPGFFVVNTPGGERYTRSGAFTIDPQGQLATQDGYKVQGVGGTPIDVRNGKVEVGTDGTIRVDSVAAGQLRLLQFPSTRALKRDGGNLFSASPAEVQKATPPTNTFVQNKALESSNVNLPQEITSMMLGMRAYEANQKVVQAIDSTMGRLIDQVGFPS
jgi:flagellar basal-body rod protein FlgF